jgi:hypothetical protein
MDVFLLPFIFSFRAVISFLHLLQASLTICNAVSFIRFLFGAIFEAFHASFQWIGFLFWLFVSSYTGRFWFQLLQWIFIVPLTFITFFRYMHNFGPKHRKQSLLDILCNPVPGVEFDGRIGESEDFASLRRRRFNHTWWHIALLETNIYQLHLPVEASLPLSTLVHWHILIQQLQFYQDIKRM